MPFPLHFVFQSQPSTLKPRNHEEQNPNHEEQNPNTQKPWNPNKKPQPSTLKPRNHEEQNPNHKDRKKHIREVATAKESVAIEPKWQRLQAGTTGLLMISLWIFGWVSWFLFLILSGSLGKRFLMFVGFVKGTRFLLLDVSLLMLPTDMREWETEWVRDRESMAEKLSL